MMLYVSDNNFISILTAQTVQIEAENLFNRYMQTF